MINFPKKRVSNVISGGKQNDRGPTYLSDLAFCVHVGVCEGAINNKCEGLFL